MGYVQKGWMMPQKAGVISARMYDISITTTGTGLRGLPATGTATFTIDTNTPAGELIVSGIGSALFEFTTNTPLLTASLLAVGSTTFALTTNTPTIGAEANLTASASFAFTGGLTAYGVGHMVGNALPYTELSPQSLANAVWSVILAEYTEIGTAGNALGLASSGGVDYTALSNAVWANPEVSKLLSTSKFIGLK
jgi:hypothetical protein